MERVRGFPFLESATEVEDFIKWCEESDFKCLRGKINFGSSPAIVININLQIGWWTRRGAHGLFLRSIAL